MQNYSQNPTLRAVLAQRQNKGFSEVEVTDILRQLLPQIDKLHLQNQAHCQISLDTIIQNNHQIILTSTPTPQPVNQINIQQDIYALGVVIIALLTGKVANSLKNADGSWNWQDDCFVSDQFADVINRMIGNSVQGKFNYINEIITVLGFSTPAQPVISSPVNQVVNSPNKNKVAPWKFGLIAAGSTILVGLAGFGVWNLVSPMFSSVTNTSTSDKKQQYDGLFPIVQNGKLGFIDRTGKIIINPQFYLDDQDLLDFQLNGSAIEFNEGLAPIKITGKWGYIDKTGKTVINPQFDEAFIFNEGLAPVGIGSKSGYIDKTGKTVINPQFDEAFIFNEGLAPVGIGSKSGYIDKTGKTVINPQFDIVLSFNEGIAAVEIGGKWVYIDKTGKTVINPQFDVPFGFNEGLAPIKITGKWGYIDKTGKTVINPQFDVASSFNEGIAPVEIGGKWGYIDKTGKTVINPQFDKASLFRDGLAKVNINNEVGYINTKGEYIWQPTK